MATTSINGQLTNIPGRAVLSGRSHHVVVDSPPPLGGPNEELNPLDYLLGALSSCGIFVFETAAREKGFGLSGVSAYVEGDFDPRGVKGEDVDPAIQEFRMKFTVSGVSMEEAEALLGEFQRRCPVYTTLSKAAPILTEIELG